MLVLSRTLVLSPEDEALPDGTPLILWDNVVTFGSIEADSEELNYPASNLANPATNLEWRASTADSPAYTEVHITITTNEVEPIDAIGIARHNFGTAQIPVSVEKYTGLSGSPAVEVWEEIVQPQIPPNDEPLLLVFTPESIERIRIVLAAGDEAPRASVVYCGPLLRCQRGVVVDKDLTPPRFGVKTDVINGRSERGDYFGRIVLSKYVETEVSFAHFTPDWYRTYFHPFVQEAQRDVPFFYAWAPDDYPYEVGFNWLADDPIPMTNPVTRRVAVSLKLGGIVE